MPGRHSLFWTLVALVAGFCLLMIAAADHVGHLIDRETSYLSGAARQTLAGYAREAEAALRQGPQALDQWRQEMQTREPGWLAVVDQELQPLDGRAFSREERRELRYARHFEGLMSRRFDGLPLVAMPFGQAGEQLVMRLPERFRPWQHHALLTALALYVVPALLSALFCALLYAFLISPLEHLRRQASALRGNDFHSLLPPSLARRRDELGELGRALEHLARRLGDSVTQQQQLLHDLSHELRTPLSRLRVACEGDLAAAELRERVEREVVSMQQLVDNTLELAWLDSEEPRFACEPVEVAMLWEVLADDACFESGWPRERIRIRLPDDCRVMGNLNALAQAMENVLRNAIRHSPPGGEVCLSAQREGWAWRLSIADQGAGVADGDLQRIFRPFSRLSSARPGGDGFGLGLAIASRMVAMQGGRIWAENGRPGLRVNISLPGV